MQRSDFTPELAGLFERYSSIVSNPTPDLGAAIDTYLEIAGEKGGRPVLDLKHTEQLVELLRGSGVPAEQIQPLELLCLKTLAKVASPGREVPWPANIAPLAEFLVEHRSGGSDHDPIDLRSSNI